MVVEVTLWLARDLAKDTCLRRFLRDWTLTCLSWSRKVGGSECEAGAHELVEAGHCLAPVHTGVDMPRLVMHAR